MKKYLELFKKEKVTQKVKDNILKYFKENLNQYQVEDIVQYSEHPDDDYLFMVVAKKVDSQSWSWWSCWNNTSLSLTYGHYDYLSQEACYEEMRKIYRRL